MTEQEEREQIKAKALSDIEYIKKQSENTQTLVRIHIGGIENIAKVDSVLSSIETIQPTLFDTGTLKNTQLFVTNFIGRFAKAVRAFNQDYLSNNTKTELLEASEAYINATNPMDTSSEKIKDTTPTSPKSVIQLLEEINDKTSDTDRLVQLQKKIDELNAKSKETSKLQKEINEIKESIIDLQSSDAQIEITKTVAQARQLFDKAKDSQELFNDEIQKLISAKERQIAYTLSEQFSEKTDSLKRPIWSYLLLIISLPIYLSLQNMDYVELLLKPASNEIYWHTIFMLLLTKLPIVFLIFFVLNEYTKAKKLFEEYEHKRIMAATLVNNLERLKNELHADEKDLLELIKVPFEKIFDNPVHSIYGDKSGDKNIGLDQLEKITSIIKKMESK